MKTHLEITRKAKTKKLIRVACMVATCTGLYLLVRISYGRYTADTLLTGCGLRQTGTDWVQTGCRLRLTLFRMGLCEWDCAD